jgi:hypothetical protein
MYTATVRFGILVICISPHVKQRTRRTFFTVLPLNNAEKHDKTEGFKFVAFSRPSDGRLFRLLISIIWRPTPAYLLTHSLFLTLVKNKTSRQRQ